MTQRDLVAKMSAEELMEWSLYFKVMSEMEAEAALKAKAQQKLNSRKRGSLRRGSN